MVPVVAGLAVGAAFVTMFALGLGYIYPPTGLSSPYYDSVNSPDGESALLLINRCTSATSPELASPSRPSVMERTWISASKIDVQPYQLGDDTPCTIASSDLLSNIPKLEESLKGADGCTDGSEVCAVSYGFSTTTLYSNGIDVADDQDYELSLSKEDAQMLTGTISFGGNLAILVHHDKFYLLAFHSTSSKDSNAQVEAQIEEPVTLDPVRLEQGRTLVYTLKIRTFATYGGPVNIALEAHPGARDSGLIVKMEPDVLTMDERSEAEVRVVISTSSERATIPKDGIYPISISGRINDSNPLPSPCGLGDQCPVVQIGDSRWEINTYGNDTGFGMGGRDPPEWLSAEVTTDKQGYQEGENVSLRAYIVNEGDERVTLDDARMVLQIYGPERRGGTSVYSFDAILTGSVTVEPKSKLLLAREFEWDQKSFGYGIDPHPVRAGSYVIDLLLSGYEGRVFHDSRDIRIEASAQQQSTDGGDGTEAREIAVYALLASDPRLAKYREGVYGHAEDFQPLRKEPSGAWIDEAVMHVIKEQIVEGDWQTGYNVTYRGLTDVNMEIRSAREILSIEEIPLADTTHQYTFNEQDKEIIRAALDNVTVRQTLESKEELGYSTFATVVAYNGYFASSETLCPPGKCGRVHFQVEDTKQVMLVWLNTDTRVVARIDLSMEWKQDCRQFACKES